MYNCEKYLDDLLTSMSTQTMDLDNLKLIMADDESTDNSARIIKSWQESFPELITCIHKEAAVRQAPEILGLNVYPLTG